MFYFDFDESISDDISGSIFSEKLAFLKPSTWTNGFLFFFFLLKSFKGEA
jgi:hypothetical protein